MAFRVVRSCCQLLGRALILLRVHLLNRQDSVRPEIILEGWSLEYDQVWGRIGMTTLRNEGRGPAVNLWGIVQVVNGKSLQDGSPFCILWHEPISFLGPGKEVGIDWWKAAFLLAGSTDDCGIARVRLIIIANDVHGGLHQTIYQFLAMKKDTLIAGFSYVADGLVLLGRYPQITPGWRLRLRKRKSRLVEAATQLGAQIRNRVPDR